MNISSVGVLALALSGLAASNAQAATATANMPVTITIQNACNVSAVAPTTLAFGTQGPLTANVDQTSTITVTCTNLLPYSVGLGFGQNGTSNTTRKMALAGNFVAYQLYSDAARTTVWGNTPGTDTVAGTGNGNAQTLTVNGRVPAQTTPAAGSYADLVAVTVNY